MNDLTTSQKRTLEALKWFDGVRPGAFGNWQALGVRAISKRSLDVLVRMGLAEISPFNFGYRLIKGE